MPQLQAGHQGHEQKLRLPAAGGRDELHSGLQEPDDRAAEGERPAGDGAHRLAGGREPAGGRIGEGARREGEPEQEVRGRGSGQSEVCNETVGLTTGQQKMKSINLKKKVEY